MGQDRHGAKLEDISECTRRLHGLEVRWLTRNTPVMKPWAATEVISSGGATSLLWLDGGGMVVCMCPVVSYGEQEASLGWKRNRGGCRFLSKPSSARR